MFFLISLLTQFLGRTEMKRNTFRQEFRKKLVYVSIKKCSFSMAFGMVAIQFPGIEFDFALQSFHV